MRTTPALTAPADASADVASPATTAPTPTGTTIRMALTGCSCDPSLLTCFAALAPRVQEAIRLSSLTPLTHTGHDFPGGGSTLVLVLAESHVAIHAWPELDDTVVVELSVCDHQRPNRDRARALAARLRDLFAPRSTVVDELELVPGTLSVVATVPILPADSGGLVAPVPDLVPDH